MSSGHGRSVGVLAAGVLVEADDLLLVRRGHGAAAGRWGLPAGAPAAGETLVEAVVRNVEQQAGVAVLCGPFLGWYEVTEPPDPYVAMCFQVLAAAPAASSPVAGGDAAESRLVPSWQVSELPLEAGQAEFLADRGIIDLVV